MLFAHEVNYHKILHGKQKYKECTFLETVVTVSSDICQVKIALCDSNVCAAKIDG